VGPGRRASLRLRTDAASPCPSGAYQSIFYFEVAIGGASSVAAHPSMSHLCPELSAPAWTVLSFASD
jgi:hypothetical protein